MTNPKREYTLRDWSTLWPSVEAAARTWEEGGISIRALGDRVGIPKSTLDTEFRRRGINTMAGFLQWAEDQKHAQPDAPTDADADALVAFRDKKKAEEVDWRELAGAAEQVQNIAARMDDVQRIANVEIKTDKPVAIMFTGDWHGGDMATDHASWVRDMEFALKTDGLYLVTLGDLYQNMRSFKTLAAVIWQAIPPPLQGQMIRSIVDEMTQRGKLLALLTGNHDGEFDERVFGQAIHKYLLDKLKAPKFENRGLLKLTVGKIEYSLLLYHKSRFRSFMRASHGGYREYTLSYPADIVAGGHDHRPAFEMMEHYTLAAQAGEKFGGRCWLVKVGTYQDSAFGWRYFHNGGPGNITAVLFPGEKKIVMFENPVDAMTYIRGYGL